MDNSEKIKEILRANDIVDVIGSYISLIPKGKNHFCICPFHDDHSPSMSVSKDKQIFRCFVCGESGNALTFLMKYLNIPFLEACEILGEKCGIKILKKENKKNSKYEKYYDIYNKVTLFYKNNLNTKEGIKAKKYLEERNIDKKLIDEFDIGLSLNGGLGQVLLKNYDKKTLVDLDIINENLKDSFTNRIIFPIRDTNNNIVAFSGRIYNEEDINKYRNTKETIIFKKGQILYNFYNAKDNIRKAKEVIICEGFMDVIRLHSIGIKNAVAIMGSNMTKEQIKIIKDLKVSVTLNLDQDHAGKTGSIMVGEQFLTEENINLKVIVFNKAKDSDELITKYGKEDFITAYRNKIDFIDFKLDFLKNNKNLSNAEDLSKYINEAIESINKLDDDILKEIKITELSNKYNINKSTLLSKIVKNKKIKIKHENKPIEKEKLNKFKISEIRIIYLMMNYPEVINIFQKRLGYLINKDMNYLASEIVGYKLKYKEFKLEDFITHIINDENLNTVFKKVMSYNHMENYTDDELEDYINTIKLYSVKKEIEKYTNKLKNSLDINEKKELLKKIENMKKEVLEW